MSILLRNSRYADSPQEQPLCSHTPEESAALEPTRAQHKMAPGHVVGLSLWAIYGSTPQRF